MRAACKDSRCAERHCSSCQARVLPRDVGHPDEGVPIEVGAVGTQKGLASGREYCSLLGLTHNCMENVLSMDAAAGEGWDVGKISRAVLIGRGTRGSQ